MKIERRGGWKETPKLNFRKLTDIYIITGFLVLLFVVGYITDKSDRYDIP